ncbi:MAG TPA: MlaD family protein [Solirubrobacteraceae bacterium]|jgi:phospholipid/cholesterol/gamma-HCH transport system substrate-binding protein|nr:MlaD family protein [Solirubrobacteraceae bacterium]
MHDRQRSQPSAPARALALGALLLAIVVVLYLLLSSGSPYRVRLLFSDASGLVTGDQVMIGPSSVGSVQSITLTPSGQAAIVIGVDSSAAPLYQGTVARVEENGLAGIASHYITLQPADAKGSAQIASGGTIPQSDTYAEVSLDQVFNTLNPQTRTGLRNIIQGEAAGIKGKALAANKTLEYLDPLLQSTSQFTAALDRDEPAFDGLLVQGAQTMQLLASRSNQLTDLVSKADSVTAAVAGQSKSLDQALTLLPTALSKSTTTFAGLRGTIDALRPLVAATKPQVKGLAAFATALNRFATAATPTLGELAALISNPKGSDLTALLREAPALEHAASSGFPAIIASLRAQTSSGQVQALREYIPDIVAALANTGQMDGYYDANGHYGRGEPFYGAYGISGGTLTNQSPADRYNGLTVVKTGRCPGGATQPGDGSMPESTSGCDSSNTPAGP